MSLLVSKVPRSLEFKTRLFGFELADLLFVFLYMASTNLVFGTTPLKGPVVWLGTVVLGTTLYFAKRGKPDHYLEHYGEYLRNSDILSAGAPDTDYRPYYQNEERHAEN